MSWYLEDGKDSDVVVSSRVRIARNIAGKKFVSTASDEELKECPYLDAIGEIALMYMKGTDKEIK